MTKLSIITVVRNDRPGLARTCKSVQSQMGIERGCVEHIIWDGSDRSVADDFRDGRDEYAIPARYFWSPPRGVYAAMNEALAEIHGDYVQYLNAGDVYTSEMSLAHSLALISRHSPDWAYGITSMETHEGVIKPQRPFSYEKEQARRFRRGKFPMHPSIFYRKSVIDSLAGFDDRYFIAADYKTLIRLGHASAPLELKLNVATFTYGGISTTRWISSLGEAAKIRREMYGLSPGEQVWDLILASEVWIRGLVFRLLRRESLRFILQIPSGQKRSRPSSHQ